MVRKRGVRVAILVEDRLLERFAREALLELGYHRRELRALPYPVGRGSAKQWVDQQYPIEMQAYRRVAQYQRVALLVGSEADELSVERRRQQLASSLESADLSSRGDEEHVCIWVPKWHVETWILHLLGEQVDEETNYKSRVRHLQITFSHVAAKFVAYYRTGVAETTTTLPSLELAIAEAHRLDF